jgi:hypothetical protein
MSEMHRARVQAIESAYAELSVKVSQNYTLLAQRQTGRDHVQEGLYPCQDAVLAVTYKDTAIVAVSDGFGEGRAYSQWGSRYAVYRFVYLAISNGFVDALVRDRESVKWEDSDAAGLLENARYQTAQEIGSLSLSRELITSGNKVVKQYETEKEDEEGRLGCMMLLGITTGNAEFVLQIGDGHAVLLRTVEKDAHSKTVVSPFEEDFSCSMWPYLGDASPFSFGQQNKDWHLIHRINDNLDLNQQVVLVSDGYDYAVRSCFEKIFYVPGRFDRINRIKRAKQEIANKKLNFRHDLPLTVKASELYMQWKSLLFSDPWHVLNSISKFMQEGVSREQRLGKREFNDDLGLALASRNCNGLVPLNLTLGRSDSTLYVASTKVPCETFFSEEFCMRVVVCAAANASVTNDQAVAFTLGFMATLTGNVFDLMEDIKGQYFQPFLDSDGNGVADAKREIVASTISKKIPHWIDKIWQGLFPGTKTNLFAVVISTNKWSLCYVPTNCGLTLEYVSESDDSIKRRESTDDSVLRTTRFKAFSLSSGGGLLSSLSKSEVEPALSTSVEKLKSTELVKKLESKTRQHSKGVEIFSVQDIEAYKRWLQLYSHKQNATYQQQQSSSNAQRKRPSAEQAKQQQANQQRTAQTSVKPQALTRRHPLQGPIKGRCEVWFGPCDRMYDKQSKPLPLDPDYVYVPSFGKVICREEYVNAPWYVSDNRLHIILIDGTVLSGFGDFPYSWLRPLVNRTNGW